MRIVVQGKNRNCGSREIASASLLDTGRSLKGVRIGLVAEDLSMNGDYRVDVQLTTEEVVELCAILGLGASELEQIAFASRCEYVTMRSRPKFSAEEIARIVLHLTDEDSDLLGQVFASVVSRVSCDE